MTTAIDGLKAKLVELQQQHANGTVTQAQFEEKKATIERQILELVLAGAPTLAVPQRGQSAAVPAAQAKPSAWLLVALGVGVVAIAAAGYGWNSSVAAAQRQAIENQMAAANADAASQTPNAEQIAAMTEKLAERLAQSPDDVEGWTMLARAYSIIGRHGDALKAYQTASNLRKDDPSLLADYADSLAVNNGSNLEGEPIKLVERALKLDPQNLKALYLAGAYDFDRKNYVGAIQRWETLVASAPPGNGFVGQVQGAIAEARRLAGMPVAAAPADALPARAATATATDASVSGTVTLAASLARQAQPDDTVFVFARAAEGSRMPLAILRKQVRDLPITFNLNDSMAMSPASALSSQSQVIVGARISKSGNAMAQPGDLQGLSAPVKVGSSGLTIEIKEVVQ